MAGELRAPFILLDPLIVGTSAVRSTLVTSEPLTEGTPSVRSNYLALNPLTEGSPKVRLNWVTIDSLAEGFRNLRLCLLMIDALHPVAPEETMSTTPFPGFGNSPGDPSIPEGLNPAASKLPGLAFSVHKKPGFKTQIAEAASGVEIRNSITEMPRWDFELTYEFLEDRTGSESSLNTIVGFFLSRRGSFDSWLFKDPDDYLVVNGFCGNSDGVTTQFPFCRTKGDFVEIINQVDTVNTINVYHAPVESRTIPAGPGPYTITVAHPTTIVEDQGVTFTIGGSALVKVASAPIVGQYSVNIVTGVYTFAAADANKGVKITYRYTVSPSAYTVTMPNLIVFTSAPSTGKISSDCQFYFACRFVEDMMDFEKFADKLWSLQSCEFRSIIQ